MTLHPIIMRIMVKDIHDALGPADQAYFRPSREARLGRSLEEHQTGADANAEALRRRSSRRAGRSPATNGSAGARRASPTTSCSAR